MFNPLTQTQKDDAINVFNKTFESLTLEEAFHLGALLKEIELSNSISTEEYNEMIELSSEPFHEPTEEDALINEINDEVIESDLIDNRTYPE